MVKCGHKKPVFGGAAECMRRTAVKAANYIIGTQVNVTAVKAANYIIGTQVNVTAV